MNDLLKVGLGLAAGAAAVYAVWYATDKATSPSAGEDSPDRRLTLLEKQVAGLRFDVEQVANHTAKASSNITDLANETWHIRAKFYETGLVRHRYRIDLWEKLQGIDTDDNASIANMRLGNKVGEQALPARKYTPDEAVKLIEYYDLDEFEPAVQAQINEVL